MIPEDHAKGITNRCSGRHPPRHGQGDWKWGVPGTSKMPSQCWNDPGRCWISNIWNIGPGDSDWR